MRPAPRAGGTSNLRSQSPNLQQVCELHSELGAVQYTQLRGQTAALESLRAEVLGEAAVHIGSPSGLCKVAIWA